MRIAFLVLSHKNPRQLLRLLTALRHQLPEAAIVVHHDRFRTELTASELDPIGNTYLLTSDSPIIWGDFSLVDACWRSMVWMIDHMQFEWLILLSAQDYPIKPLDTLEDYLAGLRADVLLETLPINELNKAADRRDRRRRYLYQYKPAAMLSSRRPAEPSRLRHWARTGTGPLVDAFNNIQPFLAVYRFRDQLPSRVGWRARATPFSEKEPCRFGSMWFTISRRAAEYLAASVRDRPDYAEYYRRTIIPDESATGTLICNAPGLRVEPQNLHYTRWTNPKTAHPDVFTNADLPELLAVPAYFARKFDIEEDDEILDSLDEILAGSYGSPKHVTPRQ